MAARQTPTVGYDTLRDPDSDDSIEVGSDIWFNWLELHKSFRYECAQGKFTACKEERSSGWFWYANRKVHGKLRRTYIGATEDLTLDKLREIAQKLDGSDLTYWGSKSSEQQRLKPEVSQGSCVTIDQEELVALQEDRKQMQYLERRNQDLTAERDQLAAEVERLRAELEQRQGLPNIEAARDRALSKLKLKQRIGEQSSKYKQAKDVMNLLLKELS